MIQVTFERFYHEFPGNNLFYLPSNQQKSKNQPGLSKKSPKMGLSDSLGCDRHSIHPFLIQWDSINNFQKFFKNENDSFHHSSCQDTTRTRIKLNPAVADNPFMTSRGDFG